MIKFTEEQKEKLKKTNEQYLIGRLSLSRDKNDYPPLVEKKQPVSKMKNSDSIAYFVELISVEPDEFDEDFNGYFSSDFFIGIDFCTNSKFLPKNYKKLNIKEREKRLYKHLSNKLIVFKPKINFKGEYAYKNLEIVALISDDRTNKKSSFSYCPICLDDSALSKGKEIYLPKNTHSEKFQSIIFSEKNIYLGKWIPVKGKENYWIAEVNKKRPIVKFSFDELLAYAFKTEKNDLDVFLEHKNIFINIDNHTCFFFTPIIKVLDEYICYRGGVYRNIAVFSVNKDLLFSISKYCLVSTEIERKEENKEKIEVKDIKKEIEVEEKVENKMEVKETITTIKKEKNNKKEDKNIIKKESILLNHLNNIINQKNLLFDNDDILNVYTSLKTKNLTVLSGMTGIGKGKLIRVFAETFGLNKHDNTLLVMQPNSSYEDPSDVLGFYNAITNKYIPSECGLLDILLEAHNNKDKMHMVIFENINNSKIEDWFGPILYLLDSDKEERVLTLYNENIECSNSNIYPSKITLGDNILFAATINIDETKKDFSDRFFNKINLINISKKNFISLKELNNNNKTNIANSIISYDTFNKFKSNSNNYLNEFSNKELALFDQLHKLLCTNNETEGISYKTLVNIAEYISNIPKDSKGRPLIDRSNTLDSQIKQRILGKIKGSEKEYVKLLGTCNSISGEIQESLLYEFFNSMVYSEISNFNETKKEIIRKSKELDLYGYTE